MHNITKQTQSYTYSSAAQYRGLVGEHRLRSLLLPFKLFHLGDVCSFLGFQLLSNAHHLEPTDRTHTHTHTHTHGHTHTHTHIWTHTHTHTYAHTHTCTHTHTHVRSFTLGEAGNPEWAGNTFQSHSQARMGWEHISVSFPG